MYTIETKDVAGLKSVFNDLSNHKPIFTDDRLGRRMTLERNFHKNAQNQLPSRSGPNRYVLVCTVNIYYYCGIFCCI